jgi:hypothetical protein
MIELIIGLIIGTCIGYGMHCVFQDMEFQDILEENSNLMEEHHRLVTEVITLNSEKLILNEVLSAQIRNS